MMVPPIYLQAWRKRYGMVIESYFPFIQVFVHGFADAYCNETCQVHRVLIRAQYAFDHQLASSIVEPER